MRLLTLVVVSSNKCVRLRRPSVDREIESEQGRVKKRTNRVPDDLPLPLASPELCPRLTSSSSWSSSSSKDSENNLQVVATMVSLKSFKPINEIVGERDDAISSSSSSAAGNNSSSTDGSGSAPSSVCNSLNNYHQMAHEAGSTTSSASSATRIQVHHNQQPTMNENNKPLASADSGPTTAVEIVAISGHVLQQAPSTPESERSSSSRSSRGTSYFNPDHQNTMINPQHLMTNDPHLMTASTSSIVSLEQHRHHQHHHRDHQSGINISKKMNPLSPGNYNQCNLPTGLDPMGDHFEIVWSNLSYKIEPKWYKKINFFDRALSHLMPGQTIDNHSSATSTASSSAGMNDNQHQMHSSTAYTDAHLAQAKPKSALDPIEIFTNLNGTIKSGQMTAVLGPSGAGKTTLLNCLTGKSKKGVSGYINLKGANGKHLKMCTIPQKGESSSLS